MLQYTVIELVYVLTSLISCIMVLILYNDLFNKIDRFLERVEKDKVEKQEINKYQLFEDQIHGLKNRHKTANGENNITINIQERSIKQKDSDNRLLNKINKLLKKTGNEINMSSHFNNQNNQNNVNPFKNAFC